MESNQKKKKPKPKPNKYRQLAESSGEEAKLQAAANFTVKDILSHIYYYRIHDHIEQIALLNTLPAFLKEHPEVKCLCVVVSIWALTHTQMMAWLFCVPTGSAVSD